MQRAEFVLKLLTHEVAKWLPPDWQSIDSLQKAARWIDDLEQDGAMVLIAEESTNNALVGMLILSSAGPGERQIVHIGYLILPTSQGKGFATELVKGFVDWASSGSEIESVFAGVSEAHVASRGVLEKSGFSLIDSDEQTGSDLMYQFVMHD